MCVARRRALALLVATLAPRAAGEEATLASLTGLFQREPDRAAALVASAREGARAINQSRHSEGHETYFRQRRRVEAAVGDYRFYVHAGGAFDAITTALFADANRNVLKHKHPGTRSSRDESAAAWSRPRGLHQAGGAFTDIVARRIFPVHVPFIGRPEFRVQPSQLHPS